MRTAKLLPLALCVTSSVAALADDKVDLPTIHRIKREAFDRGQVMEHLFWLTDYNGPRLTGSPGYQSAAEWAVKRLKDLGGANVHLEKWGTLGRGWTAGRYSVVMTSPMVAQLDAVPKAWTSGTSGPVVGEVVWAPLYTKDEPAEWRSLAKLRARVVEYAAKYKGQFKGKVVLVSDLRELKLPEKAAGERYDDKKLGELSQAPAPVLTPSWEEALAHFPAESEVGDALDAKVPLERQVEDFWFEHQKVANLLADFFRSEGVAAVLSTDGRGDGGLLFSEAGGDFDAKAQPAAPTLVLTPESYNRLVRLVKHKVPVKVEVNVEARFTDPVDAVNVVAEIPGGKKKDELVMLGAHLDSWHAGTGATDNGTGSAVVIEAFRILKTLGLPMDRTVRLALWSGEEQGLFGSRGYVRDHFADPLTMKIKPEHAKLAAYFNLDNGSGKIRGVYLQDNDAARPIFEGWMAPFRDLGMTTLTGRNTFGTDHLSYNAVGLPGFQFIQDPLDYSSRTHHSRLDVYDHALAGDLMQAAAVMASFVYLAANRAEPLPRKPLPEAAAVGATK